MQHKINLRSLQCVFFSEMLACTFQFITTLFSGKRIRDNVNVAIKRVFKEKVRRWGQLDGKTVPLEFELLHKATRSGNPGTNNISHTGTKTQNVIDWIVEIN